MPSSDSDPFDAIRLMVGFLLGLGTIVALGLWLTGVSREAILIFGLLWSIYGLVHAMLDGVLDPLLGLGVQLLQNVGLVQRGPSYSAIEALVARGEVQAAIVDYAVLVRAGDAEALVRRAALLSGSLQQPDQARSELEQFREARQLSATDDVRVGLALAEVYEHGLNDPGQAMRELRRLLDLYPLGRRAGRLRRTLSLLKQERFGRST